MQSIAGSLQASHTDTRTCSNDKSCSLAKSCIAECCSIAKYCSIAKVDSSILRLYDFQGAESLLRNMLALEDKLMHEMSWDFGI